MSHFKCVFEVFHIQISAVLWLTKAKEYISQNSEKSHIKDTNVDIETCKPHLSTMQLNIFDIAFILSITLFFYCKYYNAFLI